MTVTLGDGLVMPGGIDPSDLKEKLKTFLEETPGAAGVPGHIKYKGYKVSYTIAGATATITAVQKT